MDTQTGKQDELTWVKINLTETHTSWTDAAAQGIRIDYNGVRVRREEERAAAARKEIRLIVKLSSQ